MTASRGSIVTLEILAFVRNRLIEHIQGCDIQMGAFLNTAGLHQDRAAATVLAYTSSARGL
ncbi:MAG TPA: hypothetical protein VK558_07705 [Patescibacteria group bacterium]|nr:hypothetical protein [Patescibacteria group bacterium]